MSEVEPPRRQDARSYFRSVSARLGDLAATRREVLVRLGACDDLFDVAPADGAFYVYLQLRRRMDALELVRRLIAEHGVAVIPGSAFGVNDRCALRIAYGALTPDGAGEESDAALCRSVPAHR